MCIFLSITWIKCNLSNHDQCWYDIEFSDAIYALHTSVQYSLVFLCKTVPAYLNKLHHL